MTFSNHSPIKTLTFLIFVFATIFLIDLNKYNHKCIFSTIQSGASGGWYGGIEFKNIFLSSFGPQPANLRFQKRHENSADKELKNPGITVTQQEATSQKLEHDIHKHYEEESEDWWEVYRSYKYETTDNLGDLFRVEVEEAQVINKQHVELYDLQKADVGAHDTGSQAVLNAGIGFQQGQIDYDVNTITGAETEKNQQEYLVDVKQYQRIHGFQYTVGGLMINEYEEERLAEYRYQLKIDAFNQWEYSGEHENSQSDGLALGF